MRAFLVASCILAMSIGPLFSQDRPVIRICDPAPEAMQSCQARGGQFDTLQCRCKIERPVAEPKEKERPQRPACRCPPRVQCDCAAE